MYKYSTAIQKTMESVSLSESSEEIVEYQRNIIRTRMIMYVNGRVCPESDFPPKYKDAIKCASCSKVALYQCSKCGNVGVCPQCEKTVHPKECSLLYLDRQSSLAISKQNKTSKEDVK